MGIIGQDGRFAPAISSTPCRPRWAATLRPDSNGGRDGTRTHSSTVTVWILVSSNSPRKLAPGAGVAPSACARQSTASKRFNCCIRSGNGAARDSHPDLTA